MNPWKTYIVPVRRIVTEQYEVRARSAAEAMDKVEYSTGDLDPINVDDGAAEVEYHQIHEKV